MSFRPCFVVPALDPGPALGRTLGELSAWGLPIYVTDDGSGEETREALAELVRANPLIRLARLETNQGKGAAVLDGMRRAWADGLTHALQVDADHQHDLREVGTFLEAGKAHPDTVIAGYPRFDATVPPSRKYGRLANDVWVHINTLSGDIKDSLCGFRLYPLASALRLADRVDIKRRMTFDTDIIVRLHREGVPVLSLPVGVTYPEGGSSHFRALGDTLRLIWLHTAFFFVMLFRSPLLIFGRKPERRPWHGIRERGGVLGMRFVLGVNRIMGAAGARALSRWVTPYFFITGRRARGASRDYLDHLHRHFGPIPGLPGEPRSRDVYAHFQAFSRSTVDKLLAWSGCRKGLDVDFPDFEAFLELRRSGRGALFLGAHLGNLEMIRALGMEKGLTGLNAVVYSQNAMRFHEVLKQANPDFAVDLVQVSDVSPSTAIQLQEKVDRGEFLFIVGDRTPPSENGRTVLAPFLGALAPFPQGPYLLAHLLRCPVYLIFCCREGNRYRVRMERLADRIELPRKGREEALAAWAGRYAQSLEARCRETPLEWFNYFDFWCTHSRT